MMINNNNNNYYYYYYYYYKRATITSYDSVESSEGKPRNGI
jgi:hypothetical protein